MKFKGIYIALFLIFSSVIVANTDTEAQDYTTAMKVRYLKAFSKYVEWPSSYKSGQFIIGVLNNKKIADALKVKLNGRKIGLQSYKVVNYTTARTVAKCHMLYVPTNKSAELKTIVSRIKKFSTLLVTDKPGLITQGPGINLVMDGPKQKFELNKKVMKKSALTVSAQLEPMAAKVIR